jgi:hypothetical protein
VVDEERPDPVGRERSGMGIIVPEVVESFSSRIKQVDTTAVRYAYEPSADPEIPRFVLTDGTDRIVAEA